MARVVVGALSIVGGYLVFDGIHALVTGDYVTPASGEYAGRRGTASSKPSVSIHGRPASV